MIENEVIPMMQNLKGFRTRSSWLPQAGWKRLTPPHGIIQRMQKPTGAVGIEKS